MQIAAGQSIKFPPSANRTWGRGSERLTFRTRIIDEALSSGDKVVLTVKELLLIFTIWASVVLNVKLMGAV